VIADERAAERTTIPISLTESFFIITSLCSAIEVNENIQQHNAPWRHSNWDSKRPSRFAPGG
jgi:hypothetical protein